MDRFAQISRKNQQRSQQPGTCTKAAVQHHWAKWLLPTLAGSSLLWFFFLIVRAFGEEKHPGIQGTALIVSILLMWLFGLGVVASLSRLRRGSFLLSGVLMLFGIVAAFFTVMTGPAGNAEAFTVPANQVNNPVGAGIGVHPGRVAWVHDATAVKWDGSTGYYWDDANSNQQVIDSMMGNSICWLAGLSNESAAWDTLFHYYNRTHGNGDIGYQPGQKIVIKVDLSNAINRNFPGVSDSNYFVNDPAMYNLAPDSANQSEVSPQAVIALLRELINQAGVPASNIYLYDSIRYWTYQYWRAFYYPDITIGTALPDESVTGTSTHHSHEFDGVHFMDCLGLQGREKVLPSSKQIIYSSHDGTVDNLPLIVTQADYMINFATLKKNAAGIACCNTNHFGSLCASPSHVLPLAWDTTANPPSTKMGTYNCYVDYIAHQNLGGKTFLYLLDGLWGGWYYSGPQSMPHKWQMAPFNTTPSNSDWPQSFFASQDPVAIDSVALDFFRAECESECLAKYGYLDSNDGTKDTGLAQGADNYLYEAAGTVNANNRPSGTLYNPAGIPVLQSLGVHEHWNNSSAKQYMRNLGANNGIELISATPSAVTVLPVTLQRGKTGVVKIQLNAQSSESAIGFSLNFDPNTLQYQSASLGDGDPGAVLNLNLKQITAGVLGVGVMAPIATGNTNSYFPAGSSTILAITFLAKNNTNSGTITTPITFSDSPILREIVDTSANVLPANFNADYVTVRPQNVPPTANAQTLTTKEYTSLPILLTGSDANNCPLTFTLQSLPNNGTLTGTAPNLTYIPNTYYYGGDSFSFKVNNGDFDSVTATITINVTRVSHTPTANSQSLQLNQDSSISITFSGSDQDKARLSFLLVSTPTHGTLTQPDPTTPTVYLYTPTPGYYGTDLFTYKANNGTYDSDPATVNLTINRVYKQPVAYSQSVTTPHGAPVTIILQGSNPNAASLMYSLTKSPTHGVLKITKSQTPGPSALSNISPVVIYTPSSPFYSGADSFAFAVKDQYSTNSAPATVTINVTPPNLSAVSLTSNIPSPITANTQAALLAIPQGTSQAEYKFDISYTDMNGTTSSPLGRDFTVDPKFSWTPSGSGNYTITVTARPLGDRTGYIVANHLTFTVLPALSSVSLTASPSGSQTINTPIKLTAVAHDGIHVLYDFTVSYTVNCQDGTVLHSTTTLSANSTIPTCTWTPSNTNVYTVQVTAHEAQNSKQSVTSSPVKYTIALPVTAVKLSMSPMTSANTKTLINLSATAVGGGLVEYYFLAGYQDAKGWHWSDIQKYSTSNKCSWTPTEQHLYKIMVSARQVGHTALEEAQDSLDLQTINLITAVSLAVSPSNKQHIYNQVKFTASVTGGLNVQYFFTAAYTDKNGKTQWINLSKAYSSSNVCYWTPTLANTYLVYVYARETGHTAAFDQSNYVTYTAL